MATQGHSEHTEPEPESINVQMPLEHEDQHNIATEGPGEQTEVDPSPLNMEMPFDHEDQSNVETDGPGEHTEPEKQTGEHTEVDSKPLNMEVPFKPELTLKPWLQSEAEVTAPNDTPLSADEIVTNVLLSMNKGEQEHDSKQNPQPQDQKQESKSQKTKMNARPRILPRKLPLPQLKKGVTCGQ
ncbi:hypothetical protein PIB30_030994 [Stylosanthes scabra]|uniref:Uncharacterized protein n=1 Tax=Stylosanthes scabra TaxID=79078 RepID=A0ABU6UBY7_9FABA|nr:hypothetical protein [Stylosanthes scabra]